MTHITKLFEHLREDLARPLLFLRVLTRPNWRSWLVLGAWILLGFSAVLTVSLGLRIAGLTALADAARWVAAVLGLGAAGYTAFLFAQCEGRDLWQGRTLLPHLLAQAALCGAACYLPLAPASRGLQATFVAAAVLHGLLALAERFRRHETENARQAAAFLGSIRMGRVRPFRDGLLLGVILAVPLVFVAPLAASAAALAGLYLYEWAYVRAAQLPPLS